MEVIKIYIERGFEIEAEDVMAHQNSAGPSEGQRRVIDLSITNARGEGIYIAVAENADIINEIQEEFYSELKCRCQRVLIGKGCLCRLR